MGEEKLRILAELDEPGVRFNDVARRHDVGRGLLWQWRDAQRCGKLVAEAPGFVPLRTALAPSERYCRERGLRHKKLTDWGRQLVLQARRWMPGRWLILVTDSGFSALEFLAALLRQDVTCVTRLRLDAALYGRLRRAGPAPLGGPGPKASACRPWPRVLGRKTTRRRRVTVPGWYGEGERVLVRRLGYRRRPRHSGMPAWLVAGCCCATPSAL